MDRRRKVVALLTMARDSPWGALFKQELEASIAVSGAAIELQHTDTLGSPAVELQALEAALSAKVDALVIAPADVEGIKPILGRYRAAQIPVIVAGDELGDARLCTCTVIPDNRGFGRKMGEFFAEVTGGRGTIVEISGIPTTDVTHLRATGFREAIAGHPALKIVESLTGGWRHDRAQEEFAACLARHPRLDGVFAHNDEMARGALDAAKAVGREDELLVTGIDAIKGMGLSMIIRSRLAATLINPSPGKATAGVLASLFEGHPVLERVVLQTSLLRANERIRSWQRARRSA